MAVDNGVDGTAQVPRTIHIEGLDAAVSQSFIVGNSRDIGHLHDSIDHALIMWRQNLTACRPVALNGIIAGRVVAGGDHDSAVTLFVPNQE